ncbi:copper resistance protein B [Acinetobacter populi]|uniref:Copper resistance protein CopB n=1 Tax=Acinetobacter populi TaxID=1582270 RepID=A0A1Z9YXE9_9GAMM|nr:copper resistance protein B [Acinetobacter populi]OUY06886.1 hypothetical protein CAP51_09315 [Acinetobacter populi]
MHITKFAMNVRLDLISIGLLTILSSSLIYASEPDTSSIQLHEHSNVIANDGQNMHQHGNEIYQLVELENKWLVDDDGQGQLKSALKYWIGTDENKLYLKSHVNRAESASADYDVSLLYRHLLSEFWDIQTGIKHVKDRNPDRSTNAAILGLHGLAPYFFETDAYVEIASNDRVSLILESSRDILLTQKLITQPFIDATISIQDHSPYARRSGLTELNVGLQTRYEISKQVMPYVEFSYRYDKGLKSEQPNDKDTGLYGVGILFKF